MSKPLCFEREDLGEFSETWCGRSILSGVRLTRFEDQVTCWSCLGAMRRWADPSETDKTPDDDREYGGVA